MHLPEIRSLKSCPTLLKRPHRPRGPKRQQLGCLAHPDLGLAG